MNVRHHLTNFHQMPIFSLILDPNPQNQTEVRENQWRKLTSNRRRKGESMRSVRDHRTVSTRPRIPDVPPTGGSDTPDRPDDEEVDNPGTDTPRAQRRYVITADRFHCGDESGPDWWGSDEAVWAFTTKLEDEESQTHVTQKYGDVDSGDTRSFRTGEGEIAPVEGSLAEGVAAPVGASIQLTEEDQGRDLKEHVEEAFEAAEDIPTVGEWVRKVPDFVKEYLVAVLEDDLMGSNTIIFRPRDLERRLPTIGSSFVDRLYFGGQGGDLPFAVAGGPDYYLYVKVTRVDDAV